MSVIDAPRDRTESGLMAQLAARYKAPDFAFLAQVRNQTGWSRRLRTADAIAMGLWPSRGLHLHGFEVKVSRSDWLRELKEPAKTEEIASFCDFWWVVAPQGVVQEGELPASWGLLRSDGKALRVAAKALPLEPKALTRSFLAAILRKASESSVPAAAVDALVKEQLPEAAEDAAARMTAEERSRRIDAERQLEALRNGIERFEVASGLSLKDRWANGPIGEAVRFIRECGGAEDAVRRHEEELRRSLQAVEHFRENLRNALCRLPPPSDPPPALNETGAMGPVVLQ